MVSITDASQNQESANVLQLFCVYYFFVSPSNTLKPLTLQSTAQLVALAAVTGFVLAIVQLARFRRARAEHAAERLTALNRIGTSLVSQLDETRLLHLIAETACDLQRSLKRENGFVRPASVIFSLLMRSYS